MVVVRRVSDSDDLLFLRRMCSGRFVGMLRNVDEAWKKNSVFMMS